MIFRGKKRWSDLSRRSSEAQLVIVGAALVFVVIAYLRWNF
jgi:hypothetical protein